jgi:hypothetical protein
MRLRIISRECILSREFVATVATSLLYAALILFDTLNDRRVSIAID